MAATASLPPGFRIIDAKPQTGVPPGFKIVQEGPPPPSVGEDILSTIPATLGRGTLAIPGMVGDVLGLGMQAGRKIDQLLGNPVKSTEEIAAANPLRGITTPALEQRYEEATGTNFYDPQTPAGQTVDRILRPVPGAAVMGGGNPIRAGVKYGAVPAAAGEGAATGAEMLGLPPEYQTAARIGAEVATGGAGSLTKPRDISPSMQAIEKAATKGFQEVERAGVMVAPTDLVRLGGAAKAEAQRRLTGIPEIDKGLLPDTQKMVGAMDAMLARGSVPLTTIHKYRQLIDSELASNTELRNSDRAVLIGVKRKVDEFFDNLSNSPKTGRVLRQAIRDYAKLKRAETIQNTINLAETRIDPKTGRTREDALRAEFKTLYRDQDAMQAFSKRERQAIFEIGSGAPIARALSGLAPSSNIGNLMRLAFLGGGGTYQFGPQAGAGLAGFAAGTGLLGKATSAAATRRNVAVTDQLVRGGPKAVPRNPLFAPLSMYYATTTGNMATTPPPGR